MAKLTKEDVLTKAEQLKNWGKWGPDDQLGALNYLFEDRSPSCLCPGKRVGLR